MRILISGAGIAGPTLAYLLTKTGARVTVVEKSKCLLAQGQNIDIDGSAITAVKKMGLIDEIRRFNTTEKGTRLIDPNGRPIAPFPVKEGSMSPSSPFEILRGDLATVLYSATEHHPDVEYSFDTTITNIVSNDEKAVKVELSNGEVQEFDLLVAADGQWSRVRKQCFPAESVNVVDTDMFAVYWTIPRLPTDNDWWNVYMAKSRNMTMRPDPHGTIRAMCTIMPCDDVQRRAWKDAARSDRQTQQKLVRTDFADAGWQAERILNAIAHAPDFYFQEVQQVKMSTWSNSRVVCLGDAAYAPTPLTGAGATLAITGAYVLAGELSKLRPGEHPSRALKAYEGVFKPFVEKTQEIPSIVPGIGRAGSAWKRWALQTLARVASWAMARPWLANRFKGAGEDNDDGFPLPEYVGLEDKSQ